MPKLPDFWGFSCFEGGLGLSNDVSSVLRWRPRVKRACDGERAARQGALEAFACLRPVGKAKNQATQCQAKNPRKPGLLAHLLLCEASGKGERKGDHLRPAPPCSRLLADLL